MVAARETTLQELLEGSKQYQVPLYQRTYSWTTRQLQRLWEDIEKLAQDRRDSPHATHFIGSLVLAPSPSNGPAGVQEFLVVDGQQRLTTLSVLLCALRDHRAATESPEHRERIDQQYLTNKWKPQRHRLKLLPTQADRSSYLACLDATPQAGGGDPVGTAYRFFKAKLVSADDPDDSADVEQLEDAIISGLALVSVIAQPGDNAHRIFESLNNTGLRLTQGDLLRNYLFMRLPTRGEAVYHGLWLPLQSLLSTSNLELLFWLDLVHRDPRVKQTDTYAGQQARLDRLQTEAEIEAELERFAGLGQLLATVLDPAPEANTTVRHRLKRLNAWGTTTVYPLLLHLLDRREQGTATSDQIAAAMLYVESFFVRRLLIGRATAGVNRILLGIVKEMDQQIPLDDAVRHYLSAGRKYYATDADVRAAIPSTPYYLNGRPNQRALVLRWLEESYGSKEPVDPATLTIEHVMPQTLSAAWQQALAETEDLLAGEHIRQAHEALVHTLGNLTLTGYNSTLSNSGFDVKKAKLQASGLVMNQEIAQQPRWGRPQILARAAALAERIVSNWPGPAKVDGEDSAGPAWDTMAAALAELPAGSWTTYGDLAALIGSHPVPVGVRLATHSAPNAHRVLQIDGTVSPSFRWLEPDRADAPQALLTAEGVQFDDHGRASPTQRVSTEELAALCGLEPDDLPDRFPDLAPGQNSALRDQFLQQLTLMQSPATAAGTVRVLDAWTAMGGRLLYGTAGQTSCFLMANEASRPGGDLWPAAIYPSGKFEVVFQHMRTRSPFDSLELREALRQQLNELPGVDLPAAKLELRPGFDLCVLAEDSTRDRLIAIIAWFREKAVEPSAAALL